VTRTLLAVGCYTNRSDRAIHVLDATDPTAPLTEIAHAGGIEHASFLAAHPTAPVLYAVSETTGPDGGAVVALALGADGEPAEIDRVPSHGGAPCHVSVDADGSHVYVANYVTGDVAAHRLLPDGTFGDLLAVHHHEGSGPTARQEGPHAHCIVPGPDGRRVYAADLGTDRVYRYVHTGDGFDLEGVTDLPPGSGPRHVVFHPDGTTAFVLCELDSTINAFDVDDGNLTPIASVPTLPAGFDGASIAAEVRVHPDGRHVYASNRGHDSIAVLAWDAEQRRLDALAHVPSGGRTPRNFVLHPDGEHLIVAHQDSDSIVTFDLVDGVPVSTGRVVAVTEPVHLLPWEMTS
jgi:6-phosphogluconolactonase